MKTRLDGLAQRGSCAIGASMVTMLLMAALPTARATNTIYIATGWLVGVPVPGIWHTNALGQVLLRGNAHVARVESSEPRLAGQRLILMDGAAQADGSVVLYGNCYHQIGTWDSTGTNFTTSGGLWEISYRGVMQADNSLHLHLVGSGSGGSVEGLRLEEDLTRSACPGILDTNCVYQSTGLIKPVPANTTEAIPFDQAWQSSGNGTFTVTDGQLITVGYPDPTWTIMDSYFFAWPDPTWTVPDGVTREWRAELASLDEGATNLAILGVGTIDGMYGFHKGRDFSYLWKWLPGYTNGVNMLACDRQTVSDTNVVLALALTRVEPNLVITARVLDKADPNRVLYTCTVTDTPGADHTLTEDQFQDLTGVRLEELVPDMPGPPLTQFWVELGVFQYTDGSQPVPTATFNNLEVRTSEIPPMSIERAVRLSWPTSATINYAVEAAPTVQGPWLPWQELPMPGLQQMTVPASEAAKFFRLRQTP